MNNEDISFVVQGNPYIVGKENNTKKVIESIREFYPGSTVILSTNCKVEKSLGEDLIVENVDVGPICVTGMKPLNVNRQIRSSLAGVRAAKTKWVCKIRTDCCFTKNLNIIDIYNSYRKRIEGITFKKRVLVSDITTKNFSLREDYLNHVSDWFFFGLKEDLELIFNIPMYDIKNFPVQNGSFSPSAEVYIWTQFLGDNYPRNLIDAEKYLVNNAIILSANTIGLKCFKRGYGFPFGVNGFAQYSEIDWIKLYKKHIDQAVVMPRWSVFRNSLNKRIYHLKWLLVIKPVLSLRKVLKNVR